MNNKAFAIARALSNHYGIPEPEFDSVQECYQWIKSVLQKNNTNLKRCPYCNSPMPRKLVYGKLKYVCKICNKTFALRGQIDRSE